MNTSTNLDLEILKTLITNPSKSLYEVNKTIKERLETTKEVYPTLLRHIKKLEKQGLITIKRDDRDRRRPMIIGLTLKGLFTVILKANLKNAELMNAVMLLSQKHKFKSIQKSPLLQIIGVEAFSKAIEKMRPRINLHYFDEKYARDLFFQTWGDVMFEELQNIRKQRRDGKIPEKQLRKDLIRILKNNNFKILKEWHDYLKKRKQQINTQLKAIQQIFKLR